MKLKDVPQTKIGIDFIANIIRGILLNDNPPKMVNILLGEKYNPLLGLCYPPAGLIYKSFNGITTLYRKKDFEDVYHWWIIDKWGRTIDITRDQYVIRGRSVPSDSLDDAEKSKPLSFPYYRKKIDKLEQRVEYILQTHKKVPPV